MDSIPDEFTGFFNSPSTSSRTMALGLSQTLTEMIRGIFRWGGGV
jgi:hypothetical protein